MPGVLQFDGDCLIVLQKDLLAAAPREGCALLLGEEQNLSKFQRSKVWKIQLIWPCCNVWQPGIFCFENELQGKQSLNSQKSSQKNRFALDPQEQLNAQRWAREKNLQVLGSAHSHPETEAIPSEIDHQYAISPQLMVIMSKSGSFKSWWIFGNQPNQKTEVALLAN